MPTLTEKLHPSRFSEMSPFMAAIVAYVLGEAWTELEGLDVKLLGSADGDSNAE